MSDCNVRAPQAAVAAALIATMASLPAVTTPAYAGARIPCRGKALVSAISAANAAGGGTLRLAAHCTYTLYKAASGENGLPLITSRITLEGKRTTIRRAPSATTDFRIAEVATGGRLTLRSVTLTSGRVADDGGAILVDNGGTLITRDSVIRGNTVTGDHSGGGISVRSGGTAVIASSSVWDNHAGTTGFASGGGIDSSGSLTVTKTTVRSNTAEFGAGIDVESGTGRISGTDITRNTAGQLGGGAEFDSGTTTLGASVVADNLARVRGAGGLYNHGSLTVTGTKVIRNTTSGPGAVGGGVYNDIGSTLNVSHSRISANQAQMSGAFAGGLYNNGGTVSLRRTTIFRNSSTIAPGGVWTNTQFIDTTGTAIFDNRPTNCAGSPVIPPGCQG
ncbi:hypothetical protein [Streptomyces sp. NPDC093261]|uniref:hypothetical protein n=1 Tax=Streptomyces sp. NPDC093261 TaxID=3366037 RepID=UPI003802A1FE